MIDASLNVTGPEAGNDDTPCVNLQCLQTACPTSISGTVYDPAGNRPLYDVYVYVPNAPLAPISPGNVVCAQCQTPASGSPLTGALTDADGHFTVPSAPAGTNIPLVMQVGKWRRQITIPQVSGCVDNPVTDKTQTRLPSKSSEGDMPRIAITTGGCDVAECFLRRIGIDDSEFVSPTSSTGHVHVYTGQDGSAVSGGDTWQQTYTWWRDPSHLLDYDVVFNACDCAPYDRDAEKGAGDAYQAMHTYVNSGGRLFATHFFYNWFSGVGLSDFQSVANWCVGGTSTSGTCGSGTSGTSNYYVDTTFPKGKDFATWLQDQKVTSTFGTISLDETQVVLTNDVGTVNPGATRWIYRGASASDPKYLTKYLTFNAPVGQPVSQQCGRAVFSEFHLTDFDTNPPPTFPVECSGTAGSHANNEAALEFLFFDLNSCVQDDTQKPVIPN